MSEEFLPKPGGMVDSAQKAAAVVPEPTPQVEVEDQGYEAIRTQTESPDIFVARVATIANNHTSIVLPHDPKRRRATINATGAVTLSQTQGNADNGVGYPLAATTPLVVEATGILYANNSSGSTVTVSVLSELYA